jgi:hydrogenase maturation protease
MILVAGIGNIFLGDDGFGSEVARRMAGDFRTHDVRIIDFGIRALDLVYALMDGYDTVVIVDATCRDGEPGTVYVIEPDFDELESIPAVMEAHNMDPMRVLALARSMGAVLKNVRIVGCEPKTFGPENEGMLGLSPEVRAAIEPATNAIACLITQRLIRD